MPCFVGLDVSLKTTSVCVLDLSGTRLKETAVASEPAAIVACLRGEGRRYGCVVLEAGSLSRWLYEGLTKAGLPAVVVETRHAYHMLKGARNKTDRNDARGLAEMARAGLYNRVIVKTAATQQLRAYMVARDLLVAKAVDLELAIRGLLRGFGLKLGVASRATFEVRVMAVTRDQPALSKIVRPLMRARTLLREQAAHIYDDLVEQASHDPVCARLMTAPGVGPLTALAYKLAIEDPTRFRRSRSAAAYLGLTQRVDQSGEMVRHGHISCWGDARAREALFMAGQALLRPHTKPCRLRDWGLRIAAKHGKLKATVAVARKLAVILHHMWRDGADFRSANSAT